MGENFDESKAKYEFQQILQCITKKTSALEFLILQYIRLLKRLLKDFIINTSSSIKITHDTLITKKIEEENVRTILLLLASMTFSIYFGNSDIHPKSMKYILRLITTKAEDKKIIKELFDDVLMPIVSFPEEIRECLVGFAIMKYFFVSAYILGIEFKSKVSIESIKLSEVKVDLKTILGGTEFTETCIKAIISLYSSTREVTIKNYYANTFALVLEVISDNINLLFDTLLSLKAKPEQTFSNLLISLYNRDQGVINVLLKGIYKAEPKSRVKYIQIIIPLLIKLMNYAECTVVIRLLLKQISIFASMDSKLLIMSRVEFPLREGNRELEIIEVEMLKTDIEILNGLVKESKIGGIVASYIGGLCKLFLCLSKKTNSELISSVKELLRHLFVHRIYWIDNANIQQFVRILLYYSIDYYEIQRVFLLSCMGILPKDETNHTNKNSTEFPANTFNEDNGPYILNPEYVEEHDAIILERQEREDFMLNNKYFAEEKCVIKDNEKIVNLLKECNNSFACTLGRLLFIELFRILRDLVISNNSYVLHAKEMHQDACTLLKLLNDVFNRAEDTLKSYELEYSAFNKSNTKELLNAIEENKKKFREFNINIICSLLLSLINHFPERIFDEHKDCLTIIHELLTYEEKYSLPIEVKTVILKVLHNGLSNSNSFFQSTKDLLDQLLPFLKDQDTIIKVIQNLIFS